MSNVFNTTLSLFWIPWYTCSYRSGMFVHIWRKSWLNFHVVSLCFCIWKTRILQNPLQCWVSQEYLSYNSSSENSPRSTDSLRRLIICSPVTQRLHPVSTRWVNLRRHHGSQTFWWVLGISKPQNLCYLFASCNFSLRADLLTTCFLNVLSSATLHSSLILGS